MISKIEFKEKARLFKVPLSSIERDYAQSWLLSQLPTMAFKGGTAIRKAYVENYRFSDDLDFTQLETGNVNEVKQNIRKAIKRARNASGILFLDKIKAEEVLNGYTFHIYFRISRITGDPLKIKIDVTKHENEVLLHQVQKKKIIHPYSDIIDDHIMVYSLEEMFAEKMRSLFERTRPRDLYDVWYLHKTITPDTSLFQRKCEMKSVEPDIDELISRRVHYEKAWSGSLQHQLSPLPPASDVFDEVILILKRIL